MSGVELERPLPPPGHFEPLNTDDSVHDILRIIADRIASSSKHVPNRLPTYTLWSGEPEAQTIDCAKGIPTTNDATSIAHASIRAGSYVEREQPEAGPSTPYRRSLRLGDSTTSFIDVSDSIAGISEHPVSGGGFCDVHMADMAGEGKVALKKLRLFGNSEKAKKRFRYEAEIWIRLDHPNVLRFYGICQTGPTLYMVSPWQMNGHMTAYFSSHPDANRLLFVTQVAGALAFLHSNDPKIIHGDIKGQNVLVSQNGDALLCDFGLSMILSELAFISGVPTGVRDGGSIRWLAPELMQGSESKTEASDVFSFALLVVEGLTGALPFPELTIDAAVINAVINGRRPNNPFSNNTPAEAMLWRLLQLCWHPTVEVRPSMSLVWRVMRSVHSESGLSVPPLEKDNLPKLFQSFVLSGKCSLEEYTNASKDNKTPEKPDSRKPQRSMSAGRTTKTQNSRGMIIVKFLASLQLLSCALSVCALAMNVIMLPFFQSSNATFRRTTPGVGFATWAWLLSVYEPWSLLRYGSLLFGKYFERRLSVFLLVPYRLWSVLQVFSLLLCIVNAVLTIVTSASVSFANHSRFHRLMITYDTLSLAITLLIQTEVLATSIYMWRVRRAPSRLVYTGEVRDATPVYRMSDGSFRPSNEHHEQPEQPRMDAHTTTGAAEEQLDDPHRTAVVIRETEEPVQIGQEGEEERISRKQKGKQRAV